MAKRRLLVSRDNNHSIVRPDDTPVTADNLQFFANGQTPYLQLPAYNNTDPQEGQIWYEGGQFWYRAGGRTRVLGSCADRLELLMEGMQGSTTFTDTSAYNRDAVPYGTVYIDQNEYRFGKSSARFNGIDGHLRLEEAEIETMKPKFEDFEISIWVRFADLGLTQCFMSQYHTSNNYFDFSWWNSGNLLFRIVRNGIVRASFPAWAPQVNRWYHVEVKKYGTNLGLYVDSALLNESTLETDFDIESLWTIGCRRTYAGSYQYGNFFDGWMDHVSIRFPNSCGSSMSMSL
jgi:hypothetical protein